MMAQLFKSLPSIQEAWLQIGTAPAAAVGIWQSEQDGLSVFKPTLKKICSTNTGYQESQSSFCFVAGFLSFSWHTLRAFI